MRINKEIKGTKQLTNPDLDLSALDIFYCFEDFFHLCIIISQSFKVNKLMLGVQTKVN
jgi:hypothetical protein